MISKCKWMPVAPRTRPVRPCLAISCPLLTLSLMIDAQFGVTSLFTFHLTNIILHILSSCLVFSLLLKLKYKKETALFFSVIFLVHPALTQAATWIPGRNDSQLCVFILLAFISFLNFLETRKWKYYIGHLFFFMLALFTKETALGLGLICLYYLIFVVKENLPSFNKKIFAASWLAVGMFWFFLQHLLTL